jgi:hypothetical protein
MHERVQGINQYLKLPSIGVCMTMAEPLEPRCQKTEDGVSLNSVPALASQRIWSAVRKKMDRRYIMAVSKGVQATFASAVDYLRYHLQDDDANPSSPRGLHPAVQPKKLEIAERIQQGKHAGLSSLHALASSPHWRRLECLYLDKVSNPMSPGVLHASIVAFYAIAHRPAYPPYPASIPCRLPWMRTLLAA